MQRAQPEIPPPHSGIRFDPLSAHTPKDQGHCDVNWSDEIGPDGDDGFEGVSDDAPEAPSAAATSTSAAPSPAELLSRLRGVTVTEAVVLALFTRRELCIVTDGLLGARVLSRQESRETLARAVVALHQRGQLRHLTAPSPGAADDAGENAADDCDSDWSDIAAFGDTPMGLAGRPSLSGHGLVPATTSSSQQLESRGPFAPPQASWILPPQSIASAVAATPLAAAAAAAGAARAAPAAATAAAATASAVSASGEGKRAYNVSLW